MVKIGVVIDYVVMIHGFIKSGHDIYYFKHTELKNLCGLHSVVSFEIENNTAFNINNVREDNKITLEILNDNNNYYKWILVSKEKDLFKIDLSRFLELKNKEFKSLENFKLLSINEDIHPGNERLNLQEYLSLFDIENLIKHYDINLEFKWGQDCKDWNYAWWDYKIKSKLTVNYDYFHNGKHAKYNKTYDNFKLVFLNYSTMEMEDFNDNYISNFLYYEEDIVTIDHYDYKNEKYDKLQLSNAEEKSVILKEKTIKNFKENYKRDEHILSLSKIFYPTDTNSYFRSLYIKEMNLNLNNFLKNVDYHNLKSRYKQLKNN